MADGPLEVELKLALLDASGADAGQLVRRLKSLPALARRRTRQVELRNIYFDTPERRLRGQAAALRVRRTQAAGERPVWQQTLKLAGDSDSALSQRPEWESPLRGGAPSARALAGTPWATLDADGSLFASLAPCFETRVTRTVWQLRRSDGTRIELALDLGRIVVDRQHAPIVELELELLSGDRSALFELAQQLAGELAVLPLAASKAQRGHALADGHLHRPLRAKPGLPAGHPSFEAMAGHVLRECFGQLCANLHSLTQADHPELVHQARVGWRRFKSARRLFAPLLDLATMPALGGLAPVLRLLGEWRDMDVARGETLPSLTTPFVQGDAARLARWQEVLRLLDVQAEELRDRTRAALGDPVVGRTLVSLVQWLAQPCRTGPDHPARVQPTAGAVAQWANKRLARLRKRMRAAAADVHDLQRQHEARLLAKRLRYALEELKSLLPKRQASHWYEEAVRLQTELGQARDLDQAVVLVAALAMAPGPLDFLRGVVAGRAGGAAQGPAAEAQSTVKSNTNPPSSMAAP